MSLQNDFNEAIISRADVWNRGLKLVPSAVTSNANFGSRNAIRDKLIRDGFGAADGK